MLTLHIYIYIYIFVETLLQVQPFDTFRCAPRSTECFDTNCGRRPFCFERRNVAAAVTLVRTSWEVFSRSIQPANKPPNKQFANWKVDEHGPFVWINMMNYTYKWWFSYVNLPERNCFWISNKQLECGWFLATSKRSHHVRGMIPNKNADCGFRT